MASLFSRISLICRSKVSALMDEIENPAEVIDQTIIDAKKEYAEQLQAASTVLYNEKKVKEDLDELIAQKDKYNKIAERAVLADNDDDAVMALNHVADLEGKIKRQEERVALAEKNGNDLRKKLNDLKIEIETMEAKAAEIKADMANAKAAKAASKVSGQLNNSSFAAFERLAERAEKERMEAEALSEFEAQSGEAGVASLEDKYQADSKESTNERLAALKEKLGKK